MYSAGLDTSGSNSQPQPGKAKSISLLSTDNGQMPKGWQGKGDVQASNWSTHKLGNLFTTLYNGFLGDLQKKSFKVKIKNVLLGVLEKGENSLNDIQKEIT